jgi:cell division septal protein FtsQ
LFAEDKGRKKKMQKALFLNARKEERNKETKKERKKRKERGFCFVSFLVVFVFSVVAAAAVWLVS